MIADSTAFVRFAPFAAFILALALREALKDSTSIDGRWLYALQALGAGSLLLLWRARYRELRVAPGDALKWALAAGIGAGVFLLWIHATLDWMQLPGEAPTFVPTAEDGRLQWDLIALRAAGAVVVVPLMEELFWRSFLMRWVERREFLTLHPRQVGAYGLLVSSSVFALAHTLWFAALVAGLAYAWLYRRTGNLWFPVAAHALTNGLLAAYVVQRSAWQFW